MMANLLLLGAGFSRNWGGWLATEAFEYLLGCPEVASNPSLASLLWRHQPQGGFEAALAELQLNYSRDPRSGEAALMGLQAAVSRMFDDMNGALMETTGWEFQNHIERTVGTFLTRFDAIFTLNQDVLLEHYYMNDNIALTGKKKWAGAQLPGMRRVPAQEPDQHGFRCLKMGSRSTRHFSQSSNFTGRQTGLTQTVDPCLSWVGPSPARLAKHLS
jgi:hypothetical protein